MTFQAKIWCYIRSALLVVALVGIVHIDSAYADKFPICKEKCRGIYVEKFKNEGRVVELECVGVKPFVCKDWCNGPSWKDDIKKQSHTARINYWEEMNFYCLCNYFLGSSKLYDL